MLACISVTVSAENLTRYVNPFVGTAGFGNVYPGAQIPFGGIQISPDTDDYDYDVAAGYLDYVGTDKFSTSALRI